MPVVLTLSLEQPNLLISTESYSHEMENGDVKLLNWILTPQTNTALCLHERQVH